MSDAGAERTSSGARVVVIGSGSAALSAALVAADNGAEVLVLERSDKIGGSSAVSGGALWVPNNHVMLKAGHQDSWDDAVAYCTALVAGRTSADLVTTFLTTAPEVVRCFERMTPLRFAVRSLPDYRQEQPGAKPIGRMIEPQPLSTDMLGEETGVLRTSASLPLPLTLEEIGKMGLPAYPGRAPRESSPSGQRAGPRPWAVPS